MSHLVVRLLQRRPLGSQRGDLGCRSGVHDPGNRIAVRELHHGGRNGAGLRGRVEDDVRHLGLPAPASDKRCVLSSVDHWKREGDALRGLLWGVGYRQDPAIILQGRE